MNEQRDASRRPSGLCLREIALTVLVLLVGSAACAVAQDDFGHSANHGEANGLASGDYLPKGVARVGGGFRVPEGSGWPPSVAIVDTGIDMANPELAVVGGVNCAGGDRDDWTDTDGHGTSLAGVVAARRNGEGLIGVAPGAKLYSVRVFANEMSVSEEGVLCGLQWIHDNAQEIDVALLGFNRRDRLDSNDSSCGTDKFREMICRLVEVGVIVVVAAGNQKVDARGFVPAKLDEVITVGAIVDFDGVPGGLGSPTCGPGVDDTVADFSNTGSAIDLFAPGVCIETTRLKEHDDAVDPSGTSLAAAHVAGAAAVYKACNVRATPDEVRSFLLDSAETLRIDDSDILVVSVAPFCET